MDYSNYIFKAVRAAAILTNSYVAGQVLGLNTQDSPSILRDNQLILYVSFTKGSLTIAEVKVEFSDDDSTYYQESYDDIAAATGIATERVITRTFDTTGNYRIAIPITDKYVKISSKGTGSVAGSSMTIGVVIGNN